MVRLANAEIMDELVECGIPVRFVFVILGPELVDVNYHELGRSISTLMANKVRFNLILTTVLYYSAFQSHCIRSSRSQRTRQSDWWLSQRFDCDTTGWGGQQTTIEWWRDSKGVATTTITQQKFECWYARSSWHKWLLVLWINLSHRYVCRWGKWIELQQKCKRWSSSQSSSKRYGSFIHFHLDFCRLSARLKYLFWK